MIVRLIIGIYMFVFMPLANADVMEELRKLQSDANKVHEGFKKEGRKSAPEETDAWVAQGETGYVSCLLTTLAEGNQDSVELYLGGEFVSLVTLSEGNSNLQKWTKKLNFNYKTLSMNDVLAILVNSFELQKASPNYLKTVLVQADGSPLAVLFTAELTRDNSGVKINIVRADNA